MRISKLPVAVCALLVCAGFAVVRAEDTPAQAAARAALLQKMNELDAEQGQPTNQTPPPAVVTPAQTTVEQPAPATNETTEPTTPAETQPAPATMETAPAPVMTPAPASSHSDLFSPAPPASNSQVQPSMTPVTVPAPATTTTTTTTPPPAPPVKADAKSHQASDANKAGKELGLKPIEAPPLPVTAQQEAQLQALLQRYKADQITPDQYQAERAKILGGQ